MSIKDQRCDNCYSCSFSAERKQLECRLKPPVMVTIGYLAESREEQAPNVDPTKEGKTAPVMRQITNTSYGWAFPVVGPADWCANWTGKTTV